MDYTRVVALSFLKTNGLDSYMSLRPHLLGSACLSRRFARRNQATPRSQRSDDSVQSMKLRCCMQRMWCAKLLGIWLRCVVVTATTLWSWSIRAPLPLRRSSLLNQLLSLHNPVARAARTRTLAGRCTRAARRAKGYTGLDARAAASQPLICIFSPIT